MITLLTVFSDKRRTLSININRDGTVTVHAPAGTSMERIRSFVKEHEDWITTNHAKIQKHSAKYEALEKADIENLRKAAKDYIPERVKHFSYIMGVCPSSVKITSARSRFGSCSGKNSLCFSLYLMLYPKEAIDYVVVHELAHIREKNHSASFYAIIEKYMPDYKKRIRLLKQ